MDRKTEVVRKTRETEVRLKLDLDGEGNADVRCEEQFLRHMVGTLARYADFDLALEARGDDVHHLVEDVAIVLGKTLKQCLGESPIERTAFSLIPMDDALVQVAVDIIERPYADVDCPNALYAHFLRSFAMSSGITLHVMVLRGYDEHHIVEASFKALGKALRAAVRPRRSELSTKDRPKVSTE
ncbi:MAG TPA: imidazoleglycerol-phosphate dehydratase [Methanomassiliicoccales archaeon]|jgi:imidazoleglycerol-phosphate dehydratase|nr:imidazoleglycerol-phosphate dehydratase [Euryarchaeota archaeon]HOE52568.1 imidazoleglycerol-phosphate dehydratase [Methanomassiliicoccales archaeon]HQM67124.1 imidazoleglycerol-phosphate dehydratase [Methanomassiliicoccales archaeon]